MKVQNHHKRLTGFHKAVGAKSRTGVAHPVDGGGPFGRAANVWSPSAHVGLGGTVTAEQSTGIISRIHLRIIALVKEHVPGVIEEVAKLEPVAAGARRIGPGRPVVGALCEVVNALVHEAGYLTLGSSVGIGGVE